jgi:L-ascorbate metabolism protein UlaG (beta-lactamase superfamily)
MIRPTIAALATLVLTSFALGAPSPGLETPPPGGARVWYLGHCGYAVRTSNHLLVFDYQERRDGQSPKSRPETPSLDKGWVSPAEVSSLKVRVFVSHSHDDHYDPVIFTWKDRARDIAYFFGWPAAQDPAYHYSLGPRTGFKDDDLEVATINSHHAGVPEVAWLVKVDGLVIYHNGDCQPDDPAGEYDFLRTKAEAVDLAFVMPLIEDGEKYGRQNRVFTERFRPKAVFPMHVQAGGKMYFDFQKSFEAEFPRSSVLVPTRMGQEWILENGHMVNKENP